MMNKDMISIILKAYLEPLDNYNSCIPEESLDKLAQDIYDLDKMPIEYDCDTCRYYPCQFEGMPKYEKGTCGDYLAKECEHRSVHWNEDALCNVCDECNKRVDCVIHTTDKTGYCFKCKQIITNH